jgi:hypothetical protein
VRLAKKPLNKREGRGGGREKTKGEKDGPGQQQQLPLVSTPVDYGAPTIN